MRTTLKLDPDIHHAVRSIARERGENLGVVVSSLVRTALQPRDPATLDDGFPVFGVGPDAPPLTPEMVRDALEDV